MELSGIAIIGIGIELPLSELEWNCVYRNWSGIAFIGIGVELPLSELELNCFWDWVPDSELELNSKNGIDPSFSKAQRLIILAPGISPLRYNTINSDQVAWISCCRI